MKQKIKEMILAAATGAHRKGLLPSSDFPDVEVEEPKIETHGDFSTNLAMVMASVQKMPPRRIAQAIIDCIEDPGHIVSKADIAGPGFINFFIELPAWHPILRHIHETDQKFGASDVGNRQKVQVEFVSANPTGPLHVGHGRGAAVGDSVANILKFCGFDVQKEYYINDSGRQIRTLGNSVFLRYREQYGHAIVFPDDCYQGDYINEIATKIRALKKDDLLSAEEDEAVSFCARYAAREILAGIKTDLADFGVHFDNWYSEQTLFDTGKVDAAIVDFREQGIIYQKEGALWFKTSDFGDEKDRVVVRNNGQSTYFASDIAYHRDKYLRGFQRVIDVWGADHHGYIPRMTASVQASGHPPDGFDVILVQLVNLLRGGEQVAMSTRAGEFVTLKDVVAEVGADAARFIFLTRHYESPLDFDLELAKKKTNDNPVYYVQYVHARIASILRRGAEIKIDAIAWDDGMKDLLSEPEEIALIKMMARFPEVVQNSAAYLEPHRITFYLMNLAAAFHVYYNRHRVLTDRRDLAGSRLYLVTAVQKVIRNGLALLGVSAPESM